jgi:hypothetical protein
MKINPGDTVLRAAPAVTTAICTLATVALVLSCAKPHEDPNPIYPATLHDEREPAEARLRHDLVGRDVLYYANTRGRRTRDGAEVGIWTVSEGEIKDFVIVRRFPNIKRIYGERTDEVHTLVTLEGTEQRIRGLVVFQYIKEESPQGWKLYLMGPRDGDINHDFSFERIRLTDGKVIARMAPADAPEGPWRFAPTTYSTPIPELRKR